MKVIKSCLKVLSMPFRKIFCKLAFSHCRWYSMEMDHTVCSLKEIGANLERARQAAGLQDKDLTEAAGVNVARMYHIKNGLAETGARTLALMAVRANVTPNEVLLRAGAPAQIGIEPDAEDIASISRVHHTMDRLKALRPAGALNCWEFFANILEEVERNLLQGVEFSVPVGTTIQQKNSVKTYDAPNGSKGPSPISKVSEPPPPRYGKKKRVAK